MRCTVGEISDALEKVREGEREGGGRRKEKEGEGEGGSSGVAKVGPTGPRPYQSWRRSYATPFKTYKFIWRFVPHFNLPSLVLYCDSESPYSERLVAIMFTVDVLSPRST